MSTEQSSPPDALLRSLIDGPSRVRSVDWREEIGSTNQLALEHAAAGQDEIVVVGAERQTAGRGRLGRDWASTPGRSLTFSLLLRPPVPAPQRALVPLLAGLALAEVASGYCPQAGVGLKWPNDLLIDGRKCAGILVEGAADGAVVAGIGINVDWRGVERWDELAGAGSLAEATDLPLDRWRVLAAFLGVFNQRYEVFCDMPEAFLDGYRARCVTLGQRVRVELVGSGELTGEAVEVDAAGALVVRDAAGAAHAVSAGDVHHLR